MATAPKDSSSLDPEEMPEEDKPELLKKLQERKERHAQRGIVARAGVVVLGGALVVAGIFMSGPGWSSLAGRWWWPASSCPGRGSPARASW